MNNCSFTGRVASNPETRTYDSGKKSTSFSLAVKRNFKKDAVDFINMVAWGKTGEIIAAHSQKGDLVGVVGSLETRSYEQDGRKRTIYEIIVSDISFLEKKRTEEQPKEETPITAPEIDKETEYYQPSIDADDSAMLPFSLEG